MNFSEVEFCAQPKLGNGKNVFENFSEVELCVQPLGLGLDQYKLYLPYLSNFLLQNFNIEIIFSRYYRKNIHRG